MMKTSVRQDSIGFAVTTPSRSIRAAIRNLTPRPPLQVERGCETDLVVLTFPSPPGEGLRVERRGEVSPMSEKRRFRTTTDGIEGRSGD
jgi:hypothetical protein